MVHNPNTTNIEGFLNNTPQTGNWEFAYNLGKAVVGAVLILTGFYILYEAVKAGYFTLPSFGTSNGSYSSPVMGVDDMLNGLSAIAEGISGIISMAEILGAFTAFAAPFTLGVGFLGSSYSFFFPSYKKAHKEEFAATAKANASTPPSSIAAAPSTPAQDMAPPSYDNQQVFNGAAQPSRSP